MVLHVQDGRLDCAFQSLTTACACPSVLLLLPVLRSSWVQIELVAFLTSGAEPALSQFQCIQLLRALEALAEKGDGETMQQ